jgi:hypothetical protein
MARSNCWVWLAFAVIATGCGGNSPETVGQVRDRYRLKMAAMRSQMRVVHERVPATATGMTNRLDPAPIYSDDGGGNTDFIALEHLTNLEARVAVDLSLGRDLATALSWTGPASIDDPTARREATADIARTFDHALATRYLVVLRSSRTPITGQQKIFTGGDSAVEAFVVDLKTNAIVASVSARGAAAGPIQVDMPAGYRRAERADALISTQVKAQLRQELAAKLSQATGGSFSFGKTKGVLAAGS